jgi:hypothetical protein
MVTNMVISALTDASVFSYSPASCNAVARRKKADGDCQTDT